MLLLYFWVSLAVLVTVVVTNLYLLVGLWIVFLPLQLAQHLAGRMLSGSVSEFCCKIGQGIVTTDGCCWLWYCHDWLDQIKIYHSRAWEILLKEHKFLRHETILRWYSIVRRERYWVFNNCILESFVLTSTYTAHPWMYMDASLFSGLLFSVF